MAHGNFFKIAVSAAVAFTSIALRAQSPAEPTAYTVTVRYQITGAAMRTTYRLGSKVVVDQVPSAGIPPSATPASPTRTLYLLNAGQSLTWEPANAAGGCTRNSFKGDAWLDPFSGAADLSTTGVEQIGSEVIHGIATKIFISKAKPGFKLWIDPKTGLMMKAEFTPPSSGAAMTYFEVTRVQLEPPPAALFAIPAHCAEAPEGQKSPSREP